MRRLLLLALALFSLFWWVVRALRLRPAGRRRERKRGGPPAGGTMVRDRVCNTFLPRERALRLQVGAEEHFFCSEACRRTFLAQKAHGAGSG